jgi:hypothetical protein
MLAEVRLQPVTRMLIVVPPFVAENVRALASLPLVLDEPPVRPNTKLAACAEGTKAAAERATAQTAEATRDANFIFSNP